MVAYCSLEVCLLLTARLLTSHWTFPYWEQLLPLMLAIAAFNGSRIFIKWCLLKNNCHFFPSSPLIIPECLCLKGNCNGKHSLVLSLSSPLAPPWLSPSWFLTFQIICVFLAGNICISKIFFVTLHLERANSNVTLKNTLWEAVRMRTKELAKNRL